MRSCVLGFLLAAIFSTEAVAQQNRGIGGTAPSSETVGKKYAVIIGVNRYDDAGIGQLQYAVADAVAVHAALTEAPSGFEKNRSMLLTDSQSPERRPTRSNILKFLNTFVGLARREDTVLVYFGGHGTTVNEKLYLLPCDASIAMLEDTAIPFARIEGMLKDSPAKRKVFILDACHSGTGRSLNRMSRGVAQQLERASEGMVILASCGPEQVSYEMPEAGHGAFTYFLLQGLQGQADANSDGFIGVKELSTYTWDKTSIWAANKGFNQSPWELSQVSGDIVLARVHVRGGRDEKTETVLKPPPPTRHKLLPYGPSASSEAATGYSAERAFDDNPDTTWRGTSNRGWLQFNFKRVREISEIRFETVTDSYGSGVPKSFRVELFVGGQWEVVYKKYGNMTASFSAKLPQPSDCTAFRINVEDTIDDGLPLSIADVRFK